MKFKSALNNIFKKEIEKITNNGFREDVINLIEMCPDYISHVPASVSGKYHPSDSLRWDGMLRHIRRCLIFKEEFVEMYNLNNQESDILTAGCIIHDIYKQGEEESGKMDKRHPILIFDKIVKNMDVFKNKDMMLVLAYVCLFHMGRWTPKEAMKNYLVLPDIGPFSNGVVSDLTKTMHIIDAFSASRKIFESMKPFKQFLRTCKDVFNGF